MKVNKYSGLSIVPTKSLVNYLIILAFILIITGCKSSGNASDGPVSPSSVGSVEVTASELTDLDIATAIYTDQRTPSDFYTVDVPNSEYYTVVNLKSTDLLAIADRAGEAVYELGTDDFTEALRWSETAANYRPVYKQLVNSSETDWYFQFSRVDMDNPQFVELHRVLKLSAIDRTSVDLNNLNSYRGTIGLTVLTETNAKMIDEYFWTFSFDNNYGNAILGSRVTEADHEYTHTMTQAHLAAGASGECDTIEITRATYSIEKSTGDIFMVETPVKTIYASQNSGAIQICES